MRRLLLASIAILAATASVATAATFRQGSVEVDGAWSRPAAAGTNGAGYMTITNRGAAGLTLKSVESPLARKVEMHQSLMTNGVMSMKRVDSLPIAPGKTVSFAPGAYHIMLIGLTKPLKTGDTVPATLTFANGAPMKISFQVGAGAPMKMDSMDMEHMDHMAH